MNAITPGPDAVQVVSAQLMRGPSHLAGIREDFVELMEKNERESVAQVRGNMSHARCHDPRAFERASYTGVLQTSRG